LLNDTALSVKDLDLEDVQVPRQRKPPKRYTGDGVPHVATTVEDYYRPQYFLLVDNAVQNLKEYFQTNSSLLQYQALENVLLTGENRDVAINLSAYEEIDWADLRIQVELFRRRRSIKSLSDAVCIMKGMAPELRGEYNEVEKLIRLLLVSPAASAEAERSFSALRRLKTWLRSTMTQQRLNSVAVCHVHQEELDNIDVEILIDQFIARNETCVILFGK